MRLPAARELLDAWERGLSQPPVVRALLLLAEACPDDSVDALADLPIGERDRRLLDLREGLFGARLTAVAACPTCGEQLEAALTLADVRQGAHDDRTHRCEVDGYVVTFRLPTSHDVIAAVSAPRGERGKALLASCIVAATRGPEEDLRQEALPDHVVTELGTQMAAADPQADVELGFACATCDGRSSVRFDITSFLWQEVDVWAQRTLRDVSSLARAYGWREPDVLALTPARRRMYLELCGA